jgi:hypothetical protein
MGQTELPQVGQENLPNATMANIADPSGSQLQNSLLHVGRWSPPGNGPASCCTFFRLPLHSNDLSLAVLWATEWRMLSLPCAGIKPRFRMSTGFLANLLAVRKWTVGFHFRTLKPFSDGSSASEISTIWSPLNGP